MRHRHRQTLPDWAVFALGMAAVAAILWLGLFCGCAASQPIAPIEAGPHADIEVQQVAGQLAAAVKADLEAAVDARVEAQVTGVGGDVTGYRSEFGVGATLIVSSALILTLILSHRREMQRLKRVKE